MEKKYDHFARRFHSQLNMQVLTTVLAVLDDYQQGKFVSTRVLYRAISYVQVACVFVDRKKIMHEYSSVVAV